MINSSMSFVPNAGVSLPLRCGETIFLLARYIKRMHTQDIVSEIAKATVITFYALTEPFKQQLLYSVLKCSKCKITSVFQTKIEACQKVFCFFMLTTFSANIPQAFALYFQLALQCNMFLLCSRLISTS